MSANLENLLRQFEDLSVNELVLLLEGLSVQLRQKTEPKSESDHILNNAQPTTSNRRVVIPGAYRPTLEQVEARLAAIFTPEELSRLGKTDFSKLPIGVKTASEMLNEDREDRF